MFKSFELDDNPNILYLIIGNNSKHIFTHSCLYFHWRCLRFKYILVYIAYTNEDKNLPQFTSHFYCVEFCRTWSFVSLHENNEYFKAFYAWSIESTNEGMRNTQQKKFFRECIVFWRSVNTLRYQYYFQTFNTGV